MPVKACMPQAARCSASTCAQFAPHGLHPRVAQSWQYWGPRRGGRLAQLPRLYFAAGGGVALAP